MNHSGEWLETHLMRAIGLYAIFLLAAPIVAAQGNPPVWRNGAQEKMCGLGTYYDSLDLAFKNATQDEGETLVTVQVLPSFHREYALVLKRVGQKVTLLHATLEKELWTQLGPPLSAPRTRQQCLDLALAAKVDTVELPAPADATSHSWASFREIDLETDVCPRRGKRCAFLQDGTEYVIETNDVHSLRISEIGNLKGIKSENAALLDWVRTLLQVAESAQSR
jgi:hypothetical protein